MQEQTKELLCYLWDNYLEIHSNSSITLMGVGDAYHGVKQLLISRGTSPFPSSLVPSFPPLRPPPESQAEYKRTKLN